MLQHVIVEAAVWPLGCAAELFDTGKRGDDPRLSTPIVLRNPENLAFSDHVHRFDAFVTLRAVATERAPCMARQRRFTCR